MERQYNPSKVEEKWYWYWMTKKLFSANVESSKPKYSIVIPPPNVTGILHMGHALNNTIQDILIRWKRMSGYEVLWMPGTDHAGIATQNVVEKKLAKEGINRHQLGREKFIEKVWEWKNQYHATITNQLKRLGTSCDWDRERFTMDEGLSRAVRKVFVMLYNDGLIYKGKYIINWCPRCQTALSDEESEHKETNGNLYYFKYPYADGSGYICVATTRPETMLGDTAVAVNPKDERFNHLIGKMVILPLVNRHIPIIADDFVDKQFGTGAVKVTPAHDPNDFLMGKRHSMEPLVIMDETARMCGPIPKKYIGMDRFSCRKEIIADLQALGLVEKIENHNHSVGHCYRCNTQVEPYYSDQWFVSMKPLAVKALEAAYNNEIRFYPVRWRKTYIDWMENIRDWCISRQIWWGHRIPVWYCNDCNNTIVLEDPPAVCNRCSSKNLIQDSDVLDTWFSSWLWPFSTMGWPENTALLRTFYPTNTLVTAPEILFFWVARMVMAGLYCTGKLPFTDIVLHGTVRDKSGKKMSKSLGNAIDPLQIIDTHGADALRFSLMMITALGSDVYLSTDTFDIGRNFCNKLWNAARFVFQNIDKRRSFTSLPQINCLDEVDRWILSRLNRTAEAVKTELSLYRFNEASRCLYDFIWHDFCDWYIEAKKTTFYQTENQTKREDAINMCGYVLGAILKLLHPFMPHITEEIWVCLREKIDSPQTAESESVIMASYPQPLSEQIDQLLEERFGLLQGIVTSLRTMRCENNIAPDKKVNAIIIPASSDVEIFLCSQQNLIKTLARVSELTISLEQHKPKFAVQAVVRGTQIFLELEGIIDRKKEIDRLNKELQRVKNLEQACRKKLENPLFLSNAPSEVIAKESEKLKGLSLDLQKLEKNLAVLQTD